MRVGIFGGSFNPIHTGHIQLATAVREACQLDEVWLMVSPQNPLKQQAGLLADEQRLALAREALKGIGGIKACDYEFHLPRPSYTWHTLQHLATDYPAHEFVLLIGGDNWHHFQRWHHWQDILRHHAVIVYPRDAYPGTIDVPLLDISSTEIRRRVSQGESISGMVPVQIEQQVTQYYSTR